MKFISKKPRKNIVYLIRRLGYKPISRTQEEYNCVRSLRDGRYPRFHLYIRKQGANIVFNLHLDQKKPSYSGAAAHSGEYQGPIIEKEAERIKELIKGL